MNKTTQHKPKFYTAPEIREHLRGRLKTKMFEYLRDTLHLIPPPLKTSNGRGIIALYPESSLKHLQRVLTEKKSGLTFRQVGEKLQDETRKVFEEAQFWREGSGIDREVTRSEMIDILRTGNQPALLLKRKVNAEGRPSLCTGAPDMGKYIAELKVLFHKLDKDKSVETREAIRLKILEAGVMLFSKYKREWMLSDEKTGH